jgi:hypothetical protein
MPPLPVRRFTVEEYHRMLETGVLKDREPYELIHGWIVRKMGTNPPHTFAVGALMELLPVLIAGQGVLRVMQPITTPDSEPEPDVVIASGSKEDYKKRHPKPPEVFLLVEVADTSLREDQTTKLELYAGAKIAVYWIVNLVDRRIEVYTEPRGGKNPAYKKHADYGPEDAVPVVVAGKELGRIAVKELLP